MRNCDGKKIRYDRVQVFILRLFAAALARPLSSVRRMEHARRMHPRRKRRKPLAFRRFRFRARKARTAFARGRKGRYAPCNRHHGIRPRARRRSCNAFGGSYRRRAGYRKIDAAFTDGFSRGESERQCDARTLRVGRRIRRADKRAERTARFKRRIRCRQV